MTALRLPGISQAEFRRRLQRTRVQASKASRAVRAEDRLRRFFENPPGPGPEQQGMTPGQRQYLFDPSKNRLLMAGNKVGKTYAMCCEDGGLLTGRFRVRQDVPFPCKILWLVPNLDNAWPDDVSQRFHEVLPPELLHRACKFDRKQGYTVRGEPGIQFKPAVSCKPCEFRGFVGEDEAGARCPKCSAWLPALDTPLVIVRSGEQVGGAVAGISADKLTVNEPMREETYGEAVRAAGEKNAPISIGFTAANQQTGGRDLTWFRHQVEGDSANNIEPAYQLDVDGNPRRGPDGQPLRLWSVTQIRLSPENCPHRKPEDVMQQIANVPPGEYEIRVNGGWETVAQDRALTNFGEDSCFDSLDELPGHGGGEVGIGVCADHGEHAGAEFWLLYAFLGSGPKGMVWFLDEYASPDRTTEVQDVRGIQAMLERNGLSIHDVDRWHGDVNSAGKSRLQSVNELFEQELTFAVTGQRTPTVVRISGAAKGSGSIAFGSRVMNSAFGTRRLWVHKRCQQLRRALRHWRGTNAGADADYKHSIDAARYGCVELLEPRARGATHLRTQ